MLLSWESYLKAWSPADHPYHALRVDGGFQELNSALIYPVSIPFIWNELKIKHSSRVTTEFTT